MRIVLDGSTLTVAKTGIGHYTSELSRHLAQLYTEHEYSLVAARRFTDDASVSCKEVSEVQASTSPAPSNVNVPPRVNTPPRANTPLRVNVETNFLSRRWWSIGLPRYLRRTRAALFHGTNNMIPLAGACPSVLTIHDLSVMLHPELHERREVRRGRWLLPRAARRAQMIITPTESVRREVINHLRIAPERVIVVPEAARRIFRPADAEESAQTRKRLGVADEFLLCVATIEPRKNIANLLDAFLQARDGIEPRPQLVLVGHRGWLVSELVSRIEREQEAGSVRWLGYLPDEDLRLLYSSCRLFVYPSFYEGFGLPPLEAMSCGAPVIASRIASISEVTNGAAHLIAPADKGELARAIADLWNDADKRRTLAAQGLHRASEFTWKHTAELTQNVYREALQRMRDDT